MAVRSLKYASLLLAVAGLAVLLLVASRSEVPAVRVGDLVATMNWAYVRVGGVVSRQPVHDPAAGDLTFWLWDGTGEIMVVAYRAEAEDLLAGERLPVMGDDVSLAGTLRMKEDFVYLVLNDPEQMEVRPPEPLAMLVADLHAGQRYQKVRLQGVIRDERTPYEGLCILSLRDASGEVDVVLPATAAAGSGTLPTMVGQAVEVVGAVDVYRDTVQVSVGRAGDLAVLAEEPPIAPLCRIGDLSAADVGRLVTVEGSVAGIDPFSAGIKYLLADGSGAVTLLLWQDLYDSLPQTARPIPGTLVRVQGQVEEYRGELEIVPELPADVVALSPGEPSSTPTPFATPQSAGATPSAMSHSAATTPTARASAQATASATPPPTPSPTPPPSPTSLPAVQPTPSPPPTPVIETRSLGDINAEDVGQTLAVELAGIAAVDYLSKGVKYTLTDATGSIALLVWQNVLEGMAGRHDLLPGSQVRVTGRIDEYQGELEIVPQAAEDVIVVDRGGRAPVEERAVAEIAPADEGRVLTVQGRLTRIEGRGWLRLWLDDGTGEMLIFVPERVVAYLPAGLGPGVALRVTGQVEIYQGTLEIIPLAGADVEVQ